MKTLVSIGLARNDGRPDNCVLQVVVNLNKYGFILEDACIQQRLTGSSRIPEPPQVLLAHVRPPTGFMLLALSRLASVLACDSIDVSITPDAPSAPRSWTITPDGAYPFERAA